MTRNLPDTLARLEAWLQKELPEVLASLRPGVRPEDFTTLETLLGQPLPPEFKALYLWRDGQVDDLGDGRYISGLFYGYPLFSLAEVTQEYVSWQKAMAESPSLTADSPVTTSVPEGAIRTVWISPGWVPFAHDHGSNHLGLDFNPGPKGTVGQIFNLGRSEYDRFVLASGMGEFLTWLVSQFEEGNFVIEEEDEGRTLSMKKPPGGHLSDALSLVFGHVEG